MEAALTLSVQHDSVDRLRTTSAVLPTAPGVLLMRVFDAVGHCYAFFDRSGQLRHTNRSMLQHLALTHDGDAVRRELVAFGCFVAGLAKRARLGGTVERLAERSVEGTPGKYVFEGIYVGDQLLGAESAIVVSVSLPGPDPLSADELQRRYKLTRKQAHVARLVAQGLRNQDIARALFLSEHTVRHHVEQVKLKLHAPTRATVAARILGREAGALRA
jgi:DNA-binding CsgD family transcriptional regulator